MVAEIKSIGRAFAALALALTATSALTPSAMAQTAKDESVLFRAPKLGPTGVPVGSVVVYPSLGLDAEYDDNIFRTKHAKQDDMIFHARPNLSVATDDWHPVNFNFSVGADIARYLQHGSQDFNGFNGSGRMVVDVADDASFDTGGSIAYGKLRRGIDTDIAGTKGKDLAYWLYEWSSNFKYEGEPFAFRLTPSYRRYNFNPNNPIGDIDRNEYRLDARVGVTVGPHTTVFVDPGYAWVRYDKDLDSTGFKRNSEGYDLRAGVAYDASANLYFEASAGYFHRNFADDRLRSLSGVSVLVRGYWNPTDVLSFMLEGQRGASDAYISSTAGNTRAMISTGARARFGWEVSDVIIVDGGVGWTRLDSRTIDQTDNFYLGDLGVKYYLSRYLYLGLRYSHEWRDSDNSSLNYHDNRVMFTISTQL